MRIPESSLRRLKEATSESLKKAQALGDPVAIAKAKKNDELVDELIRKNGRLTSADLVKLGFLVDRIVEMLRDIDWPDIGDLL